MSGMDNHLFEIETHGFTVVEGILTAEEVGKTLDRPPLPQAPADEGARA